MNELTQQQATDLLADYVEKGDQAFIDALNSDTGPALGEIFAHSLRSLALPKPLRMDASMKLNAKVRLQASEEAEDPVSDNGVAFDTLVDGDPAEEEPIVQTLTKDDGGAEPFADQGLLDDDLPSTSAP